MTHRDHCSKCGRETSTMIEVRNKMVCQNCAAHFEQASKLEEMHHD